MSGIADTGNDVFAVITLVGRMSQTSREQRFEFPPGSQHPRLDPAPASQARGPGPDPKYSFIVSV
jgi:hypothetical protein